MSETSIFNGDPGAAARNLVQHLLTCRELCSAAGRPLEDRMLDELCALGRGSPNGRRRRQRQEHRQASRVFSAGGACEVEF